MISAKQLNFKNCSKASEDEKEKHSVSEIEKKNPSDSIDESIKMLEKENKVLEKLDPEVSETNDVLIDTLDELLNSINKVAEVFLKRQYQKANDMKTLDMIKDVMTSL